MHMAGEQDLEVRERIIVHHALAAEWARARRCQELLASSGNGEVRDRCSRRLAMSIHRAARLALALVDMGEEVPMEKVPAEFDGALLDAMEMVMRTGAMLDMGMAVKSRMPVRAPTAGKTAGGMRRMA